MHRLHNQNHSTPPIPFSPWICTVTLTHASQNPPYPWWKTRPLSTSSQQPSRQRQPSLATVTHSNTTMSSQAAPSDELFTQWIIPQTAHCTSFLSPCKRKGSWRKTRWEWERQRKKWKEEAGWFPSAGLEPLIFPSQLWSPNNQLTLPLTPPAKEDALVVWDAALILLGFSF